MATSSPGLDALLASLSNSLFLPKPATPSPSSTGMFPSPNSPYSSMSDQILDAFRYTGTLPGKPINPLGGNKAARYAFGGNPANLGGNNLGQNAHKGLFTGTGLLGGGAAPPGSSAAPPGYSPPNSSGGIGGGGGLGPVAPGAGGAVPGNLLRSDPRQRPTAPTGAGLLDAPKAAAWPGYENNWAPPPASANTQQNAYLARGAGSSAASGALTAAVGGNAETSNQMINQYQVGGISHKPWLNALAQQGLRDPTSFGPAALAQWESEGLGSMVNGAWQWAAGKGWE